MCFGRKMPGCDSEAFCDHIFGLSPYEPVEKCLSAIARHFSTIFLAIPHGKWSQFATLLQRSTSRPFFRPSHVTNGRDLPRCCRAANHDQKPRCYKVANHDQKPGPQSGQNPVKSRTRGRVRDRARTRVGRQDRHPESDQPTRAGPINGPQTVAARYSDSSRSTTQVFLMVATKCCRPSITRGRISPPMRTSMMSSPTASSPELSHTRT